VDDFFFDDVVEAIRTAGDGKIFVMGLDDENRMRTFSRIPCCPRPLT